MGSFDMLHPGHLGLFEWCRKIAACDDQDDDGSDRVIVAVNSSEFIARFKTEPRYTTLERAAMVRALKGVDDVVINTGLDQPTLILDQNPDILVIGSDWARKDYLAQIGVTQDWLDEHGIGVAYVPRTGSWSSTEMRAR
jgi:cytidyltransferase-like protein